MQTPDKRLTFRPVQKLDQAALRALIHVIHSGLHDLGRSQV